MLQAASTGNISENEKIELLWERCSGSDDIIYCGILHS